MKNTRICGDISLLLNQHLSQVATSLQFKPKLSVVFCLHCQKIDGCCLPCLWCGEVSFATRGKKLSIRPFDIEGSPFRFDDCFYLSSSFSARLDSSHIQRKICVANLGLPLAKPFVPNVDVSFEFNGLV